VGLFGLPARPRGRGDLLLPRPPGLEELTRIPWWVFAGLFAVAEAAWSSCGCAGRRFSLSLSEVPL
jgi:hypothetical protein